MARQASFYDPRRATPQDRIAREYMNDPRAALAASLMEGDNRPAYGGVWEGVARAGSKVAGALLQKQMQKERLSREEAAQSTLARALMGDQINPAGAEQPMGGDVSMQPVGRTLNTQADMARILAGNPDTAGMAFDLRMQEMARQQALQDQLAAEQRAFQQRKELASMPRPGLSDDAFQQQVELAAAKRPAPGGPDIGTFNPRDYTAESFARFMESRNPNDLERFQRYKRIGGQIYDMTGDEPPRPVSDVTEALKEGKAAEAEGQEVGKFAGQFPQLQRKQEATMRSLEQQWDVVDRTIDEAITLVKEGGATGTYSYAQNLPWPTDASRLASKIDTISANVGFDKLQNMRENSPTGGALGQVSNLEIELLQAVQGSLKQGLDKETLKANLRSIQSNLRQMREEKRSAFMKDWGGRSGETPNEDSVDDLLEKYR